MRITVEEHLTWLLERVRTLPPERRSVRDAGGLTLAAGVAAVHDLPLWDNSAMDGYAVRAADLVASGEGGSRALRVVGEVAAGSAADPAIPAGCAVRIMTGAPVPSDADAVIPVELTRGDREHRGDPWAEEVVRALEPVARGANIRRAGEDVRRGSTLAAEGEVLGAPRLAALAAAGIERVSVRPRPRVAVVATGSELVRPGATLVRGQIPESNSLLLSRLLSEAGAEVVSEEVRDDDASALAARLRQLAADCDLIVTTGGVGPGRHDIVRIALEGEPEVRAVRVAVRPGQPQCAGMLAAGAFVFALPGNPVSAAVSFELFVRPAILAVQGRTQIHRLRIPATAETDWRGAAGRLQVLPVRISGGPAGPSCRPTVDPRGVSHAVGGHGAADGYALVGAERGDVRAGELVDVILAGP